MEHFEQKSLSSFLYTSKEWKRFIDDVFAKWSHGKELLDKFLAHINSLSKYIKFTIEVEKDNQIPFLDIFLTKKNGKMGFQIFRKKTQRKIFAC